jgi:membrane protein implicated in regulation of membrane protease activity
MDYMTEVLNYFSENRAQLFYLIAAISFIVELGVLGMAGPLLFFAIASVMTGMLINFNLLSEFESQFLALGVITGIITILLWKPFKRFQNSGNGSDTSSDMIGKKVPSSSVITHEKGHIRFSGIEWSARLADDYEEDSVKANTPCIIVGVEGNVMLVKPLN